VRLQERSLAPICGPIILAAGQWRAAVLTWTLPLLDVAYAAPLQKLLIDSSVVAFFFPHFPIFADGVDHVFGGVVQPLPFLLLQMLENWLAG
jgi:hypothetical protein